MTGPGDEMAAGASGQGRLRASNADREQVIEVLKAAFVQGRLDRDELDLRVGRVLASRTYAGLAALTADIPARLARARPPEPAREPAGKKTNTKKKAAAALACTTPAIVAMLAGLPPMPDGSPLAAPLTVVMCVLFGAVSTGWLVLLHAWLSERGSSRMARVSAAPSGYRSSPGSRL